MPAGPRHFLNDGVLAAACLLELAMPAGRRHERVDGKAAGKGELDARRRRALLLGGDGQAVELELARERYIGADLSMSPRSGRHDQEQSRHQDRDASDRSHALTLSV